MTDAEIDELERYNPDPGAVETLTEISNQHLAALIAEVRRLRAFEKGCGIVNTLRSHVVGEKLYLMAHADAGRWVAAERLAEAVDAAEQSAALGRYWTSRSLDEDYAAFEAALEAWRKAR